MTSAARLALLSAALLAPGTPRDLPAPPPAPASVPAPAADEDAALRALFARPLIVGASISSDFRTASPGRRLARRLGTEDALVSKARAGASGAAIVAALADEDFARASVVVGVDLFFWDSVRGCDAGLAAVDDLFARDKPRRTPLVIGNIPALRESSCRERLNARIAAGCKAAPACALLDLDAMYKEAAAAGGADLDGRRHALSEILPDGLHLSDVGSELVARKLAATALQIR